MPSEFHEENTPLSFSGIYPYLATYNQEGECGTGAVVPWAGRLWYISYGPHFPFGSSDRLYEVDENLHRITRLESVGGTHANRMIHQESNQLFIGPYVIDATRNVRVISSKDMPGRLTGTARHLFDPENKVYFASMEEGFYEVDVNTLAVNTIHLDGNAMTPPDISNPLLPGYHGKGLYTGQGRLIYANNGENSPEARSRSDIPSGCLAEWDGTNWKVVLRNQFTEVSGPGGIKGNVSSDDPIWTIGWDHRSLILLLRENGEWSRFRLPKASHTYDGAHGWNTEWPRIREIKPDFFLMTMHGMFWRFPQTFSRKNTAGIEPLSTYLKIIGDFCGWKNQVVFGCDDAAKSDFQSGVFDHRGTLCSQSNSNLWFVDPDSLDDFGPASGKGGPWKNDPVQANVYSDPFLFHGFDYRMAHLVHNASQPVEFTFEVDAKGPGDWTFLQSVAVPPSGYAYVIFDSSIDAPWIRVKTNRDCERVSVMFFFANCDSRSSLPDPIFDGLAESEGTYSAGLIRSRGEDLGTLHFAASRVRNGKSAEEIGYYEIGPEMKLERRDNPKSHQWLKENLAIGEPFFTTDGASVIVIDPAGTRYRLPKGDISLQQAAPIGWPRSFREVVTERNLFICQGNWFELPRQNAGGLAKIRPIASSDSLILDLCSWRGMLVLSGVADDTADNPHIVRSEDGKCALWFGTIDDLWKLGKPRGEGGVWKDTPVRHAEPSDPFLFAGYDRKILTLSHQSENAVEFAVEVDITGEGDWQEYKRFMVKPAETFTHTFEEGYNAYWVRIRSMTDTTASATFQYS